MSYIFSHALMADYVNCTSLQAREAEFSRANCSDTEPSAQSNGNPTPKLSLWHDKTMDASRLSRFGMTCNLFEESRGAELLTWWLEASRARTSALPEKASESLANDPGCGPTWLGSLAKFDPVSRSWKTAQLSLLGDSELSSVTWPRSGMTAGGQCWELPMLERRTSGTGCGFWQTPVADDSVNRANGKINSRGEPKLSAQVLKWPTPTVCGNHNRKGASATSGDGLATAVKMYPTPQTSDNRNRGNADTPAIARRIAIGKQVSLTMTVSGGQLSADWTEWLMGWPIGHTALKPSVTAKCQPVQPRHGDCLEGQ